MRHLRQTILGVQAVLEMLLMILTNITVIKKHHCRISVFVLGYVFRNE